LLKQFFQKVKYKDDDDDDNDDDRDKGGGWDSVVTIMND